MTRIHPQREIRSAARQLRRAALVALVALGACSGEITGVAGSRSGGQFGYDPLGRSRAGFDAALLGRWRRLVTFDGPGGTLNSSETTWAFASDGSALRTDVTRNLTFGYADAVSTAAVWHTEAGNTLVITYQSYQGFERGTARLAYFVDRIGYGDVLYLNQQPFARVGR